MSLGWACRQGDLVAVRKLLATKEGLASADGPDFSTTLPIHDAAEMDRAEVIKLLVAAGVSPNSHDRWGRTPLHLAVERGFLSTTRTLLSLRADVDRGDDSNRTPLAYAVRREDAEIQRLLIDAGADVDSKSYQDLTPLSVAASCGILNAVRLLVAAGAQIEALGNLTQPELSIVAEGSRQALSLTPAQRKLYVAPATVRQPIELLAALSRDPTSWLSANPDVSQCVASFVVGRDSALLWRAAKEAPLPSWASAAVASSHPSAPAASAAKGAVHRPQPPHPAPKKAAAAQPRDGGASVPDARRGNRRRGRPRHRRKPAPAPDGEV